MLSIKKSIVCALLLGLTNGSWASSGSGSDEPAYASSSSSSMSHSSSYSRDPLPLRSDAVLMRSLEPLSDQEEIVVTNGSLLGFSDTGIPGQIIRAACRDTRGGFSHVAIALVARPSEILQIIRDSKKEGGLSRRKKKYQREQLNSILAYYPQLQGKKKTIDPRADSPDLFCFEATGSVSDVKRGLKARVKLTPLSAVIANCKGDVYVRSLNKAIPMEDLREDLVKHLGASYIRLLKLGVLVKSSTNKNTKTDDSQWFCSELTAYIYMKNHVMDSGVTLPSNVVPAQFLAGRPSDLLVGKASDNFLIKDFRETSEELNNRAREAKNLAYAYDKGKYPAISVTPLTYERS